MVRIITCPLKPVELLRSSIIIFMQFNLVGVTAALSALVGIAFGHLTVRWVEFRLARLWIPLFAFIAVGLGLESLSLYSTNLYFKVSFGILGVTFLWDAIELIRQQRRVRRGHAPANPLNPRHRRLLEEPSSAATTINYLKDDLEELR